MEQNLFKSERFQKLKRNIIDIDERKQRKKLKQISKVNKDIENIKKNIFKQTAIPKSIYNGRN